MTERTKKTEKTEKTKSVSVPLALYEEAKEVAGYFNVSISHVIATILSHGQPSVLGLYATALDQKLRTHVARAVVEGPEHDEQPASLGRLGS